MAATLDWEAQLDEVQALAAIYQDGFRVTSAAGVDAPNTDAAALLEANPPSGGWRLSCELTVPVDLPADDGLKVRLEQSSAAEAGGSVGDARGAGCSDGETAGHEGGNAAPTTQQPVDFRVAHLPPLLLRVEMAPAYPSSQPPTAALSAAWLSARRTAELTSQLHELWRQQGPGSPVIFAWADWLQSSALRHLGITDTLTLDDPGRAECGAAPPYRAGSHDGSGGGSGGEAEGGPPQESLLLLLLRYSASRDLEAFRSAMHTCGVCLEELPGGRFVRLDCGHHFCEGCLGAQARIHVAGGSLDALKCPDPPCGQPLPAHTLRGVLPPEGYERWEQLTLQRALDTMPDAAYCPRCATLSLEDPDDNCAGCPRCFFVFCTLCSEGRHPGVQCVSAETRLAMLRRKAEGGGAAAVAELRRREHEFLSLAEVERSSKPCPACGAAIQRTEGCNKMACGNCGAFFCWKCGKRISGYDHFRAGGTCILFDEAEILRWEQRWEGEVQRHAAAAFRNDFLGEFGGQLGGDAGGGEPLPSASCPQCGQRNYRLGGNNHLCCWSCSNHFCAVCRTVLQRRGGGQHFGPGKCRQHT